MVSVAINHGETVHVDVQAPSGVDPDLPWMEQSKVSGIRWIVVTPLVHEGEIIGAVQVRSAAEVDYTPRELRLLEHIAGQISGAIAIDRQRQRLEQEIQEREMLATVGRTASAVVDLSSIGDCLVPIIQGIIPFDVIGLSILHPEDDEYEVVFAGQAVPGQPLPTGTRGSISNSAIGLMYEIRETLVLPPNAFSAMLEERGGIKVIDGYDVESLVMSPLISAGTIIGALFVASTPGVNYGHSEGSFLTRVAAQISGTVGSALLRRDLENEGRHRLVLAEIGRATSTAISVPEIGVILDKYLRALLPHDFLYLAIIDPDRQTATVRWASTSKPVLDEPRAVGDRIPIENTLTGRAIQGRKLVVFDSDSAEELLANASRSAWLQGSGVSTGIAAPLISEGTVLGVLLVGGGGDLKYSEEDGETAQRVGRQIAGQIANSLLRERLERQVSEQIILGEIGRGAGSAIDNREIGDVVTGHIGSLIDHTQLRLAVLEPGGDDLRVVFCGPTASPPGVSAGTLIPLVGSLSNHAIETRLTVFYDADNSPQISKTYPSVRATVDAGAARAIITPLISNDQVIGTMWIGDVVEGHDTAADVDLFRRSGDEIAGTMSSVLLREHLQKEADRQYVLSEISRSASAAEGVQQFGQAIAAQLRDLMPCDFFAITMIDEARQTHRPEFVDTRLHLAGFEVSKDIPAMGTVSEVAWQTKTATVWRGDESGNTPDSVPNPHPLIEAGLISGISAPMQSHDHVIGLLLIGSRESSVYGAEEVEIARNVSNQIAGVVTNALLRSNLEGKDAREKVLAAIGSATSSAMDINEILEAITRHLGESLNFAGVTMSIMDTETGEYLVYRPAEAMLPAGYEDGTTHKMAGTLHEIVFRTREPLVIDPDNSDPLIAQYPVLGDTLKDDHPASITCPLITNGKVLGTMTVWMERTGDTFSSDISPVRSIADQVAGAVATVLLTAKLESEGRGEPGAS